MSLTHTCTGWPTSKTGFTPAPTTGRHNLSIALSRGQPHHAANNNTTTPATTAAPPHHFPRSTSLSSPTLTYTGR